MKERRTCAVGGVISLLLTSTVLAQEPAHTPRNEDKLSKETEAAWNAQSKAIKKEIEKLGDHPWAGLYSLIGVELLNFSIALAPTNGFAYQLSGCLGVYDRNFGPVSQTEWGFLRLYPKYSWDSEVRDFLPVSWGQRRYLIRIDTVAHFCDNVRLEREPRSEMQGAYFLRQGDHEKPATGAPILPEQFHETCESLVNRSNPNNALTGFLAAFERLEWDRFRSYIAEDACVFHPSTETPGRICGKAEVEVSFQKTFEQIRQSSSGPVFMELRPERLEIQMLGGDVAVTSFELWNKERFGRRTIIWQKQPTGAWKIVHLHASNVAQSPEPPP